MKASERIDALEAEVKSLTARIDALEAQNSRRSRKDRQERREQSGRQVETESSIDKPQMVMRDPVKRVRLPGGKVVERVVRPRG